jgi:hypothetical protein
MGYLEIHFTQHAIERFHERVRPCLTIAAAEEELARLVTMADVVSEPPTWLAERQRRTAAAYLVVGDLVLPAERLEGKPYVLVAVTCIARGCLSDRARARRNEARQRRRRARRFAKAA